MREQKASNCEGEVGGFGSERGAGGRMSGTALGSDAHRQGQRQAKEEPANDRKRQHGGEHGKEDEGEEIEAVHCAVDPEVLPRVVFAGADVVAVGKVAPADETALELTA